MKENKEKTEAYYASAKSKPCDCGNCKIYYEGIKSAYPKVVSYLNSLGVDVLRPLELSLAEDENMNFVEYTSCAYVVFGTCPEDFVHKTGDMTYTITQHHPETGVEEPHFVLDFGSVYLPLD